MANRHWRLLVHKYTKRLCSLENVQKGRMMQSILSRFSKPILCSPNGWLFFSLVVGVPNNPYPKSEQDQEIYYSTFSAEPKHFDPAISYSSDEYRFIRQIYEPPLQYHYLKRPYELIPLTAEAIPQPRYFDANGQELSSNAPSESVARAVYEIRIRPGIMYQQHPCFAKTEDGEWRYRNLTKSDVKGFDEVKDSPMTGKRELIAADYVYQIKRMADPSLSCPILSTLNDYILGIEGIFNRCSCRTRGCSVSRCRGCGSLHLSILSSRRSIHSLSIGWRCHFFRRCLKRL